MSKGFKIFLATDGSEASKLAFMVNMNLILSNRYNFVSMKTI